MHRLKSHYYRPDSTILLSKWLFHVFGGWTLICLPRPRAEKNLLEL